MSSCFFPLIYFNLSISFSVIFGSCSIALRQFDFMSMYFAMVFFICSSYSSIFNTAGSIVFALLLVPCVGTSCNRTNRISVNVASDDFQHLLCLYLFCFLMWSIVKLPLYRQSINTLLVFLFFIPCSFITIFL